MTTLQQTRQRLTAAGIDYQGDGGGGYELYRDGARIGRVYSDADLIAWPIPEAITTVVGVPMMDATEARATVDQIKTHMDSARRKLLDLKEREGWRALGYASWRACAQAEFGQSQAYLYRQLAAAEIEQAIDSPIGENPESHLRQLAVLDTPAKQKAALGRADELAGDQPRTAKHIAQAVAEITPPAPVTPESRDADGPWFKASKSAAHPTAHHWHIRPGARGQYTAACGVVSPELPATGADASLCSVCAKHGDRRELVPIPALASVMPDIEADQEEAIAALCGETGAQYLGIQDDLYRIAWPPRPTGGGGLYMLDDALMRLRALPKLNQPPAPTAAAPDRASSYTAEQYRDAMKMDQIRLTAAESAIGRGDTAIARQLLDQVEVKTLTAASLRKQLPPAPDARAQIVALVRQLTPLLTALPPPDDQEGLSAAIDDLYHSAAGTEAGGVLCVVWALLDLEADE